MTFKEKKELETLPGRIEALELEREQIHANLADPAFYRSSGDKVPEARAKLEALDNELARVYARWEVLEALKG